MDNKNNNDTQNKDKKENTMPAIVSYLWWIGWLISYFGLYKDNKTEFNAFHLRQSFGVHISSIVLFVAGFVLDYIPFVGGLLEWALRIVIFVMMIIGLVQASQGSKKPLPIVGKLFQDIFKGIGK